MSKFEFDWMNHFLALKTYCFLSGDKTGVHDSFTMNCLVFCWLFNTFPEVAGYIYPAWNFHLVMSLPAMSFGDMFCFSRKGRTRGGEWVHPKGANSMTISGSALETHSLALGCPPMQEWTEKTVLSLCRAPIYGREAFFPICMSSCWPRAVTVCKLVNKWVWFESQTCRGWLREHLCEVWGQKKPNRTGDVVSLIHTQAKRDLPRKIFYPLMD